MFKHIKEKIGNFLRKEVYNKLSIGNLLAIVFIVLIGQQVIISIGYKIRHQKQTISARYNKYP